MKRTTMILAACIAMSLAVFAQTPVPRTAPAAPAAAAAVTAGAAGVERGTGVCANTASDIATLAAKIIIVRFIGLDSFRVGNDKCVAAACGAAPPLNCWAAYFAAVAGTGLALLYSFTKSSVIKAGGAA